jgi:hypothetical protein
MMSTCKVAFNIDYLIIHATLNIHVPQSLFCLPNVSLNMLNKDTCQYEQLQIMIDEISLVGVRTLINVIDNRLRSIRYSK